MAGPLSGIRILEFEAIGPAPFAGMLLADMGADVLVVDRPAGTDLGLKRERWDDGLVRGKRAVTLGLKKESAKQAALDLIARDAAMVDGASLLAAMFSGFLAAGSWSEQRGANILDTGAPWYDVYETKDGKYVSIGAIEERFFQELLSRLELNAKTSPAQHDRSKGPEMRKQFSEIFKSKTQAEWGRVFEGSDACFAPVLSWSEARRDRHTAS